jgi:hypothetical protein
MSEETRSWPELAIGLYDKLTGRNAEITYQFENIQVMVPSSASADAVQARWKVDGTLRISTRDRGHENG